MEQYTVYCTEEQTKKALELGAPIEFEVECPVNLDTLERSPYPDIKMGEDGEPILINPTAEQMIGWLEEQGMFIEINSHRPDRISADWKKSIYTFSVVDKFMIIDRHGGYDGIKHHPSRKEATLAAIDAALDYLKIRS